MTDAKRTKWENERVGGRKRYVWRNTVAWTLVVTVPYTIIQVGLKFF